MLGWGQVRWLLYFLIGVISVTVYDKMLKGNLHSEHCTKVSWLGPLHCDLCSAHTETLCHAQTRYDRAQPAYGSVPLGGSSHRGNATYAFLLARHGTRWPTKKRLQQIAQLEELHLPVSPRSASAAHSLCSRASCLTESSHAGQLELAADEGGRPGWAPAPDGQAGDEGACAAVEGPLSSAVRRHG